MLSAEHLTGQVSLGDSNDVRGPTPGEGRRSTVGDRLDQRVERARTGQRVGRLVDNVRPSPVRDRREPGAYRRPTIPADLCDEVDRRPGPSFAWRQHEDDVVAGLDGTFTARSTRRRPAAATNRLRWPTRAPDPAARTIAHTGCDPDGAAPATIRSSGPGTVLEQLDIAHRQVPLPEWWHARVGEVTPCQDGSTSREGQVAACQVRPSGQVQYLIGTADLRDPAEQPSSDRRVGCQDVTDDALGGWASTSQPEEHDAAALAQPAVVQWPEAVPPSEYLDVEVGADAVVRQTRPRALRPVPRRRERRGPGTPRPSGATTSRPAPWLGPRSPRSPGSGSARRPAACRPAPTPSSGSPGGTVRWGC
jgi:hypothetical protein